MNQNLSQIASLMKGRNPQEVAMQMIKSNNISNNPMVSQMLQMAQSGDTQGLNKFAENFFQQNGMNFNSDFAAFLQMLK